VPTQEIILLFFLLGGVPLSTKSGIVFLDDSIEI